MSVLDVVARRYGRLGTRVSSLDKLRMQAHADAIRGLEKRLSLVAAACKPDPAITQGTEALIASGGGYHWAPEWYETTADAQLRIIQTALACDLTRVASLTFWDPPDRVLGLTPGTVIDGVTCDDYHDLTHKTSKGSSGPLNNLGPGGALAASPTALGYRKKLAQMESANFAKLLGLLRDVPTADGQTLLDHTVVLFCTHIGWGSHDVSRLPWMLAGRGGGAIATGRYVQLPRAPHPLLRGDGCFGDGACIADTTLGPAHNDLLVSIANAMGVPITSFGDSRACKGPLKQVKV